MKRIAALLMALTLLFTCVPAVADGAFNASPRDVQENSVSVCEVFGLHADWTDLTDSTGRSCYVMSIADMGFDNQAVFIGNPVERVDVVCTLSADPQGQDGTAVGQNLGLVMSAAAMSLWMGEHLYDNNVIAGMQAATAKLPDELQVMADAIAQLDVNPDQSISADGTFFSYAAHFTVVPDGEQGVVVITLSLAPDGTLPN